MAKGSWLSAAESEGFFYHIINNRWGLTVGDGRLSNKYFVVVIFNYLI